ncbi:MAG: hypothetical protein LBP40_06505 [Campylobacteraceae bacterium]|jgi:hypothetical protein|nr:hypothetical protein [Campylobacteraceae bacterium]
MKILKTTAIISLLAMLCASSASAWGKREQNFLWGTAALITLPYLFGHHKNSTPSYIDRRYYDTGRYHAPNVVHHTPTTIVNVEPSRPQIIYVEKVKDDNNVPIHRRVKSHNYIYGSNQQQPTRVIVEHADGTVSVVER